VAGDEDEKRRVTSDSGIFGGRDRELLDAGSVAAFASKHTCSMHGTKRSTRRLSVTWVISQSRVRLVDADFSPAAGA
jgi:hypothetical protein